VPQATRDEFLQALEADDYHVLHFVGGTRQFPGGPAALVLMGSDREPIPSTDHAKRGQLVEARVLNKLLADKPELRLVYFSACHTAGLAAEVASVVPATIGLLGSITVQACLVFARGVYTSLLDGGALEVAVAGGRRSVNISHSGSREWGLPVLYLQLLDGSFLVREPDEADVEEVIAAAEEDTATAPPSDPDAHREWRKLKMLREMYQRNLEELMAQVDTSLGEPLPLIKSQIRETEEQIAELDEQSRALEEGSA
jgi:hypothetical protein